MKNIKKILIFLTFLLYSFSIIETFEIPSNVSYYKFKNFSLDKIKETKIPIKEADNKKLKKIYSKKINQALLKIKLSGIVKSGKKFYAIINGEPYKVGDKISGFIIKKIMINKIILVLEKDAKTEIPILLENY